MPNWCNNNAEFYNEDKAKVDELEARLKNLTDDDGLFSFFLKIPDDLKEDWYSWNVSNWGTKWEASVYSHERTDENTIRVNFDTAWSPPIALYEYIAQNTDWYTEATYYESGMGYIGKVSGEWDDSYNISDLASLDNVPEELLEEYNVRESMEEFEEENSDLDEITEEEMLESLEQLKKAFDELSDEEKTPFGDESGRAWLKDLLKERVVGVTFTKKDGTERVMQATLSEKYIPQAERGEDESPSRKKSEEALAVWDTEVQGWRSFRWDSVKAVNFSLGE